jgi:uncharacterized protein (TIGR02646 family)
VIRIHKPADPPAILAGRGKTEANQNRVVYDGDPAAYDSGGATFSFDRGIYGHDTVKEALTQAQYGKCAFCEAKIDHISYGDVEHFRPKAGYRQYPDDSLGRPGYYWLAYEWSNLYLSCQLCNQRFKKNTFPLEEDAKRCRHHQGDLGAEQPLYIDPGAVDPEQHIEFAADQPIARNGSLQGAETIQGLGLQRETLRERRFDRYKMLATLKEVMNLLPHDPLGRRASTILQEAMKDTAEYASMARCLMRQP